MARKNSDIADAPKGSGEVKAFVLLDCNHGRAGQVVDLSAEAAKAAAADGCVDLNPAAVAAALKAD